MESSRLLSPRFAIKQSSVIFSRCPIGIHYQAPACDTTSPSAVLVTGFVLANKKLPINGSYWARVFLKCLVFTWYWKIPTLLGLVYFIAASDGHLCLSVRSSMAMISWTCNTGGSVLFQSTMMVSLAFDLHPRTVGRKPVNILTGHRAPNTTIIFK